jgi:hypothetical protein
MIKLEVEKYMRQMMEYFECGNIGELKILLVARLTNSKR